MDRERVIRDREESYLLMCVYLFVFSPLAVMFGAWAEWAGIAFLFLILISFLKFLEYRIRASELKRTQTPIEACSTTDS